jgi:hypothetical protein
VQANCHYSKRYLTPKDLWETFGFKEGGVRSWLFHRHTNGLNAAVYKVGRNLLIDLESFQAWIKSHQECQSEKEGI